MKKPFDLLIVDIAMPEMSGIELIDKLRLSGNAIPIIVLSGVLGSHIREQLYWHDKSIKIIEKPFSIETLAKAVEKVISCKN